MARFVWLGFRAAAVPLATVAGEDLGMHPSTTLPQLLQLHKLDTGHWAQYCLLYIYAHRLYHPFLGPTTPQSNWCPLKVFKGVLKALISIEITPSFLRNFTW